LAKKRCKRRSVESALPDHHSTSATRAKVQERVSATPTLKRAKSRAWGLLKVANAVATARF
jgi:hypothetical protein